MPSSHRLRCWTPPIRRSSTHSVPTRRGESRRSSGICETVNGNWAQPDMTNELGASVTQALLALNACWGMATVGRVLLARRPALVSGPMGLHLLPLTATFVIIALGCGN